MKKWIVFSICLATAGWIACKGKGKENTNPDSFPTPALDIIKGQVAEVDSSVDPIIRIVPLTDSTYDSVFLNRKDFRALAKDFLETPDISGPLKKKYKEERTLDNNLGQAVFTAVPVDDASLEVRRQEIRIVPNPPDDKIKSLYFEKFRTNADSSVMKRMTWYMNRKFQIVTIVQKPGKEDQVSVTEVLFGKGEAY